MMIENSKIDILLVEDNLHDAELTIRALYKDNPAIHVVHVKNGVVALDFIFAQGQYTGRNPNNKPAVIFLDLKMPKLNGFDVLERLSANTFTQKIPVVVFTSSKQHSDVEKAYALGANSYMIKPVNFEDFRKTVHELGNYWLNYNQQL